MNINDIILCLSKPRILPGTLEGLMKRDEKDIAFINYARSYKDKKDYSRCLEEVANEVLIERDFTFGKPHFVIQPLICLLVQDKRYRILNSIVMREEDKGTKHYNINYWISGVWGELCEKCNKIELYFPPDDDGHFICSDCQ